MTDSTAEKADTTASIISKRATANMHKEELRPSVRKHADKLQEQIKDAFGKYGVGTAEDFTQAMATSRIPMDEARRINKLLSTLYTVTETGKIPFDFDEEKYMETIRTILIPIVDKHILYAEPFDFFEKLLPEKLPQIPEQIF